MVPLHPVFLFVCLSETFISTWFSAYSMQWNGFERRGGLEERV